MRDLHEVPRFRSRWAHVYLEHCRLEREASSLAIYEERGVTNLPVDQLAVVLLGPGTCITHAAMKSLADNNCLVAWVGEEGVRLYAHSTGGTHGAFRLLKQAALFCDGDERLKVVHRMYGKRFPEGLDESVTVEQLRGKEGYRVREAYRRIAEETGVRWEGRSYRQDKWDWSDPLNRALSAANACLYGICHAAILTAGYSPAIGFIHTGKMLSFVYDVADFYKTELTIPTAFRMVKESEIGIDSRVRRALRDVFHETRLMKRILPDIAEVLDARDDLEESPGELEGRIVSLADRAIDWSISGEPER